KVKTFNFKHEQETLRIQHARERYQYTYDQVHYTVVGSNRMAEIFMEAFNTTNESLIRTGITRTDFFFNEIEMQKVKKRIEDTYIFMKNKKFILYAPTFRDNSNNDIMI